MHKNTSKKAFSVSRDTKLSLSICVMSVSLAMLGCNQANDDSTAIQQDTAVESSSIANDALESAVIESPVINNDMPIDTAEVNDNINENINKEVNGTMNADSGLDTVDTDTLPEGVPPAIDAPLNDIQSPEDIMLEALALADDVE